jgi:hypothetical protein
MAFSCGNSVKTLTTIPRPYPDQVTNKCLLAHDCETRIKWPNFNCHILIKFKATEIEAKPKIKEQLQ